MCSSDLFPSHDRWLLPIKFNINKKIIYRSAELRSGFITREEAEKGIVMSSFDPKKLKQVEDTLRVAAVDILNYPKTSREGFESYHKTFKKYRYLIWLGVKLGYFPRTFYTKYCK